jgi:hypothetical protein
MCLGVKSVAASHTESRSPKNNLGPVHLHVPACCVCSPQSITDIHGHGYAGAVNAHKCRVNQDERKNPERTGVAAVDQTWKISDNELSDHDLNLVNITERPITHCLSASITTSTEKMSYLTLDRNLPSILLILAFIIVVTAAYFGGLLRRRPPLPPGPKGRFPLVGMTFDMPKQRPWIQLAKWAE